MNIDRFIIEHEAEWDELDALARQGAALDADAVGRLVRRYEQVSAHLSAVRTHNPDPALIQRLTRIVAAGRAAIYGSRASTRSTLRAFLVETVPAAIWWHRQFIVVAAGLLLIPAVLVGAWIAVSDDALEATAPAATREAYVAEDFEDYYSSEPAAQFATEVFFNNIQVAMLAFAVGILLCLPTALVLVYNGALVGVAAGLFTSAGRWQSFWGLITPHGLLEMSAIIVAGASGLALGWSIVAPGDRPRTDALREAGRRSIVVVLGLILAFGVAGIIEGFVTGSALPTAVRVGIGVLALAAFASWVLAYGPRAEAMGLSGVLGEVRRSDPSDQSRPVALSSR